MESERDFHLVYDLTTKGSTTWSQKEKLMTKRFFSHRTLGFLIGKICCSAVPISPSFRSPQIDKLRLIFSMVNFLYLKRPPTLLSKSPDLQKIRAIFASHVLANFISRLGLQVVVVRVTSRPWVKEKSGQHGSHIHTIIPSCTRLTNSTGVPIVHSWTTTQATRPRRGEGKNRLHWSR